MSLEIPISLVKILKALVIQSWETLTLVPKKKIVFGLYIIRRHGKLVAFSWIFK